MDDTVLFDVNQVVNRGSSEGSSELHHISRPAMRERIQDIKTQGGHDDVEEPTILQNFNDSMYVLIIFQQSGSRELRPHIFRMARVSPNPLLGKLLDDNIFVGKAISSVTLGDVFRPGEYGPPAISGSPVGGLPKGCVSERMIGMGSTQVPFNGVIVLIDEFKMSFGREDLRWNLEGSRWKRDRHSSKVSKMDKMENL